jgi:hypothetical protein
MGGWLRDTAGIYGRALRLGVQLLVGNVILVVPALACLIAPVVVGLVLAPLSVGAAGGLMRGMITVLIQSACFSALLACTGEVIRTRRLVLADVRTGFVAYLGDVINVRFVLWIITFVSATFGGFVSVMILLATLTFFNAVPELIYLGRYGTADLLTASYRFISERWIEWFPLNALLLWILVMVMTAGSVVGAPGTTLGGGGVLGDGVTLVLTLVATAVALAFAMLVRGVLFLELTESSRRARAFRQASGN